MPTTVHYKGPIFDGSAPGIISAYLDDAEREVAQATVDQVKAELDHVLRNPSGYYRSRIQADGGRVNDSGVVYGSWLEGVSSRNRSTRFRGYATFRRVGQFMQSRAAGIAENVLPRHLRRLQ